MIVTTTDGVLAERRPSPMTLEQAEASAAERNARAAELGLAVRYVVADEPA